MSGGDIKNKKKKINWLDWLNLRTILLILGLSIAISLAFEFGKSIFGNKMTISGVIESFAIVLIAQVFFQIFVSVSGKKINDNRNN